MPLLFAQQTCLQSDLNLSQSPVTDAGLAHLKNLTALRGLNLSETQITDAAVAPLRAWRQNFPAVRPTDDPFSKGSVRVSARGTKLTYAAVEKLRQEFPYFQVTGVPRTSSLWERLKQGSK